MYIYISIYIYIYTYVYIYIYEFICICTCMYVYRARARAAAGGPPRARLPGLGGADSLPAPRIGVGARSRRRFRGLRRARAKRPDEHSRHVLPQDASTMKTEHSFNPDGASDDKRRIH